jgi:hypothetical protein
MENNSINTDNIPKSTTPSPAAPSPFINEPSPANQINSTLNNAEEQQWSQDVGPKNQAIPASASLPSSQNETPNKIEFTEPKKLYADLPPIGGYHPGKTLNEITIQGQQPDKPNKLPVYITFYSRFRRPLIWAGFVLLGFFVLSSGVFGYEYYSVSFRKIELLKILPQDPNLVVSFNINPDSDQFRLLEKNMEKFPGYKVLKKELDKTGEGKTLAQAFQDNLQELGIDFANDIKPVLGEEALFVVTDLKPLGETIQNSVLTQASKLQNQMSKLAIANELVPEIGSSEDLNPRVLGEFQTTQFGTSLDYYYVSEGKLPKKPLDFILGAQIKDLKKAKEVLDKIKKNTGKYEIEEKNFEKFNYVKLTPKNVEEKVSNYVNIKETYHAIIGGNWIATSDENALKEMLEHKLAYHSLFKITQKEKPKSLALNEDYQKVIRNLNGKNEPNLSNVYYNLDFEDVFQKPDCDNDKCFDITDYIKYPQRVINGFLFRSTENGFEFKGLNNKFAVDDIKNRPISESLASKTPEKVNDRWTDVFVEYANPKGLYYNFKKNNLTQKGIDSVNKALNEFKGVSQIDVERDIIDPVSGNAALAIFCSNTLEPQASVIVEIKDRDKTLDSMKKIVAAIKNVTSAMFSSEMQMSELPLDQGLTPQQKALRDQYDKERQAVYNAIMASGLIETSTPAGSIYSYKLPLPEEIMPTTVSFDFSLENNKLILATNYAVIESLIKETKNSNSGKLADSSNFKKAISFGPNENYSSIFINTQGLWNSFAYYLNKIKSSSDEQKDETFAIGTLIKTLRLIGTASWVSEGLANSSINFQIEEPEKEDKERADKILDRM